MQYKFILSNYLKNFKKKHFILLGLEFIIPLIIFNQQYKLRFQIYYAILYVVNSDPNKIEFFQYIWYEMKSNLTNLDELYRFTSA